MSAQTNEMLILLQQQVANISESMNVHFDTLGARFDSLEAKCDQIIKKMDEHAEQLDTRLHSFLERPLVLTPLAATTSNHSLPSLSSSSSPLTRSTQPQPSSLSLARPSSSSSRANRVPMVVPADPTTPPTATTTTNTNANTNTDSSPSTTSTNPMARVPTVRLVRNLSTVLQAWEEYELGWKMTSGQRSPAVKFMEETYRVTWRKNRIESRYYCRRNILYRKLEAIATEQNISLKAAAGQLEQLRLEKNLSLNGLCIYLKN